MQIYPQTSRKKKCQKQLKIVDVVDFSNRVFPCHTFSLTLRDESGNGSKITIVMILVYTLEKPKVHNYPSILKNFQYFSNPSALSENHLHQWKMFEVGIKWIFQ